jgi:hypothetical protein
LQFAKRVQFPSARQIPGKQSNGLFRFFSLLMGACQKLDRIQPFRVPFQYASQQSLFIFDVADPPLTVHQTIKYSGIIEFLCCLLVELRSSSKITVGEGRFAIAKGHPRRLEQAKKKWNNYRYATYVQNQLHG